MGVSDDPTDSLTAGGAASSAQSSNYVNVNLVADWLDRPAGRGAPTQAQPGGALGASKCSQIRELWTPPSSPDYRDHTTPQMGAFGECA